MSCMIVLAALRRFYCRKGRWEVEELKIPDIGGWFWILTNFRELSFCGPYWPYFKFVFLLFYVYAFLRYLTFTCPCVINRDQCVKTNQSFYAYTHGDTNLQIKDLVTFLVDSFTLERDQKDLLCKKKFDAFFRLG